MELNIVNGNRGNFDQINVDSNIDDIDNWPGSVNPETTEPPLIVTSKAKVDNLNVDMLNGKFSTDFVQINSSNNGVVGGTSYLNATPPENGIIIRCSWNRYIITFWFISCRRRELLILELEKDNIKCSRWHR